LRLDGGMDPSMIDHTDKNEASVLMVAARKTHNDIMVSLIDAKADIEYKDSNGNTAIMYAGCCGNSVGVHLLLCAGADIDKQSADGTTALMFACSSSSDTDGTVRLLLKRGADVFLSDDNGVNALMMASMHNGKGGVITKLIEHMEGKDINLYDNNNTSTTAIGYAATNNCVKNIDVLFAHGASMGNKDDLTRSTPLYHASYHGKVQAVTALLNHGAGINTEIIKSSIAFTALWGAVYGNEYDVAKLLMSKGARDMESMVDRSTVLTVGKHKNDDMYNILIAELDKNNITDVINSISSICNHHNTVIPANSSTDSSSVVC